MKIKMSEHFIMLYDTPDKPDKGRRISRADERIQLLEKVYETFMMKFFAQGVDLVIPDRRLMVMLFSDHRDYLDYATRLSPSLSSASGFWSPDTNIAVFFDNGSNVRLEGLRQLSEQLQKAKEDALRRRDASTKDIVRMANTIILLVEVQRESTDITVVSHETTHQMAGNTGLLPRNVRIPAWVHEGLATYFEAPNDATWSGMGAVNEERLERYRALAGDREHSSIDFLVGDQIFSYAASHSGTLFAYGQAWALTHFMMENHFDKFMTFYRRLGEMPPDLILSSDVLNKLFDDIFGDEREDLEDEWRSYMRDLRTDMEIILKKRR